MATLTRRRGYWILNWSDASGRHRQSLGRVDILSDRSAREILRVKQLELSTGTSILGRRVGAHLFGHCRAFAAKIVLRQLIMWVDPEPGAKVSTPSANHAWFIWERSHVRRGPAISLYGPNIMEAA